MTPIREDFKDFDQPTLADKTTQPAVQRLEGRMSEMQNAWDKLDRFGSLDSREPDFERDEDRGEEERQEGRSRGGRGPAPE